MKFSEFKAELLKDPEVKKEYDNLEMEYELLQHLIDERKKAHQSQKDLT